MIININNLMKDNSETVCFAGFIGLPESYGENKTVYVELKGDISNTGDKYLLDGKIRANSKLNCDLCLEPVNIDLSFNISEVFSNSLESEDDVWKFSDKEIDLKPMILSNILINLPMKVVCSENCKGLCHICGHNLNKGDCGCDRTYINPQFEKLKAFFDDKEV